MIGQLILGGVMLWLTWYGGGPALSMLLDVLYPDEQEVVRDEWREVQKKFQTISHGVFQNLKTMRGNLGLGE